MDFKKKSRCIGKIADLELQVQSQQEKLETFRNLWIERQKFLSKSSPKHHWD